MSFIVNILVTLLHKGHIDIHFEVSTLIALGLVTFPWHTLHQFSRLQLNSGVVQDAKTSRATSSQYLQLLWLPVQVASGQVFIHRTSNIPQLDRPKEDLQEEVLVLFLWSIWSLCGRSEADLSHHRDTPSRETMRGFGHLSSTYL